jgi:glycosyltransferase involved in cell wall biosynthesis
LQLARAARDQGFEVHVAAAGDTGEDEITAEGFRFHPLRLSRPGLSLIGEVSTGLAILRLLREVRPDILHLVTIKPVIYGGLAARLVSVPAVVSAISGLGYVFLAQGRWAALRRRLLLSAYKVALKQRNGRVILQNCDDQELLRDSLKAGASVIIPGSGVDLDRFVVRSEPPGVPLVVLAARLLWDKGIGEYVEAARVLSSRGLRARFALVGEPDLENRAGIPAEVVEQWRSEGIVEIWGKRSDIPEVFARSAIVCLPSYREGFPRVLTEAAACGRPIVATDVPGCRAIVRHGENGLLVSVKNSAALASAIEKLVEDPALRQMMGRRGREMVERVFADEHIVSATLGVYDELLTEIGIDRRASGTRSGGVGHASADEES